MGIYLRGINFRGMNFFGWTIFDISPVLIFAVAALAAIPANTKLFCDVTSCISQVLIFTDELKTTNINPREDLSL